MHVLFFKVKLSKMASTKTNKIKKQIPLLSNFLGYTILLLVQKKSYTLKFFKMYFVSGLPSKTLCNVLYYLSQWMVLFDPKI